MTNETMDKKVVTTETSFEVKCNGQTLVVDFAKMHPTWVAAFMRKGAQRLVNDKLAGLEPSNKLEAYILELQDAHSGQPLPETARRGFTKVDVDPLTTLTIKLAKEALTVIFKKVTGATKGIDFAAHEKVAPFFNVSDGRATWLNPVVVQWVEKQKELGKQDFVAQAQTMLDAAGEATEELEDELDI